MCRLQSLFVLSAMAMNAAYADTVVVSADRLVDVIAGRIVEQPTVLVTDGRISAVSTDANDIPAGARHVELPE